jgi:hypothetical protein
MGENSSAKVQSTEEKIWASTLGLFKADVRRMSTGIERV